ncbi:MAG: Eco57I restriction-modification methylase domain-containing protein, partial [Bacteroidia bacterium]
GSFYTPEFLSEFIVRYTAPHFEGKTNLSVFEPSVGDGSFVKAFNKTNFPNSIEKFSFTGIDKIMPELRKAEIVSQKNKRASTKYSFAKADFLHYQKTCNLKFSFIVGNPPYVKKQLLNKSQIELCEQIHKDSALPESSVKNIWSAFLLRSCQLLTKDGVLAFVLPAELLQVKFSKELRDYLGTVFQRIEVFTFDDLLFECKGQDTILLFAFKKHDSPGQFYTHIVNTSQLTEGDFTLRGNDALVSTNTKWTHHSLTADELTFIHNIGNRLPVIDHYCDSKPGIVTAANSFFIINEETERRYRLEEYTRPIIQKALFVNGSVVFDQEDFNGLAEKGLPTKVLCFDDEDADEISTHVESYLQIGEALDLPLRYKCLQRENWYVIPNISTVPEGFFFKRSHHYPKLLKNNAEVLVTDSAYKIEMRAGYNINKLIYSFYNSLTLTFSELKGRYYGGGVLELIPSEFKNLPIPYTDITDQGFNQFTHFFENKNEIQDVLTEYDSHILNTTLNLSAEEITRIQTIYSKLVNKRFRKK